MALVTPAVEACPSCGAAPRTPLLCEACGELLEPRAVPGPFEALGLEPSFVLDPDQARRRLLALSRALHPDVHSLADAETRRLAEDATAALNAAFRIVSDDFRRADWLVRALGGPSEEQERSMPPAFLHEVLEWNETIEEARSSAPGSSARAALAPLSAELRGARARGMQRVAALLSPLPEPGAQTLRAIRQELNALRYLDRALAQIGELELGEPRAAR